MRYLCDFRTRKNEVCSAKSPAATNARSATLHARSSRTEMEKTQSRLLPSAARRGRCVPAPFQPSLRLHFTFPPPNRRPKQSVIFHHEARRRKLSNIWQWPQLRNPSNNAPAVQFGKPQFDPKQCLWRPAVRPNHLVKLAFAFQPRLTNAAANHVSGWQLMSFFHRYVKCGIHILDI